MIGSGILNQPYAVMKSGLFGAFCGYALATYMTWSCVNYLTDCGIHAEIYDYSALAMHVYGKTGERLIDAAISLGMLGSLIGYILVVGATLSGLLHSWGCHSEVCSPDVVIILAVALFITPLCLFRHFGHLAILSVFSVATIWSVLFLVIFGGSSYQVHGDPVNYFNVEGTFMSLGSMIFALSICTGNFQAFVSTEKGARNSLEWKKITAWAIAFGSFMCVSMGTGKTL